uniref:OSJNBb0046K02.1 protein n=1 Tax=Oryza sativa subsp. japonica TaxID=39947 RepID=Q7DNC2_ORYSJ|nr:OSJNBb0046K02.1 [Oryza sativa Japonica Group]
MGDNNNCVATVTTTIVKASRGEDPLVPVSGAMLVKERQGMAVEVQDPPPRPAMGGSIEGGKGVLRRGGNGFWGSDDDIGLCRRRRQYEWELSLLNRFAVLQILFRCSASRGSWFICTPWSLCIGLMSSVVPRAARLKDDVDGTDQAISLAVIQQLAQQWCRYGVNVSSRVAVVLIQQ